jgi:hypothetical protein
MIGWLRCRVPGTGYLTPGTRDRIRAEGRRPSTEDRAGKRAHGVCRVFYPASCILYPRFYGESPVPINTLCPTAGLPYWLIAPLPNRRMAVK